MKGGQISTKAGQFLPGQFSEIQISTSTSGKNRLSLGTMFIMACMASSSRSRAAVLSVVDADIPDEMALAVVVPSSSPLASLMGWSAVIISCAELARWWPRLERLAVILDARVVRLYIVPNIFEESTRTAEPWLFRCNPLNA